MKIHLAAASYKPALPLKPWLFAIVANTVRNHFRKQAGSRQVPLQDEHPDNQQSAENIIDNKARVAQLQQAISTLPLDYKEVLVLVSIQAIAQKEVAAILKIPLNTVKTRLRRARDLLLKTMPPIDKQAQGSAHE
ncbi:MAG: RNA polymerase sigma factor [gamma proteobacterium symbiont of Bathyaustriella thionipta]|nr:RNA polymerase sigma factor [gamma proteobacterium symbiont of Bathyaustriella thionipta]